MSTVILNNESPFLNDRTGAGGFAPLKILFIRYAFAIGAALGALMLTHWIRPLLNNDTFDFFQGAVFLSALFGGLGPGLMTAGISIGALDYFFIPPFGTFTCGWSDALRLLVFGAIALLTSSLSARLKKAKSDLQEAHDQLEVRIEQRTEQLSTANQRLVYEISQRLEAEKEVSEISHREQRRLGQDLHDGLCQVLAGVKLSCEHLKGKLLIKSIPEAQELESIETRLSNALAQADVISRGLYPVELESHGLMSALEELAHKIPNVYPVQCRFKCWRPVLIPDTTVATHLYRITQEAVVNAVKSGKANRVTIRLLHRGSNIVLSIADNGTGFHNASHRNGMGLKIMEYRARVIGADLIFKSRPRGGTLVRCTFGPFGRSEEER